MASRFHIEELISQDSSGVVFRAIDEQSGEPVALRRFFPFGPESGGLQEEEKVAYDISIERFSRVVHPSLRSVITGGCDPIDGVPFVVTEWLDGESLADRLGSGPLQSKQAIEVLTRALDISQVLTQLLAEEAIWIETDLASIMESKDRGITFWISPLRWLGASDDRRSLKPIVQLTEDLMGWKNKLVNDQAGNGLAGWLKWLKQHMYQTTLAEARETLAAATGGQPPVPTSKLVKQSTRPANATPTARATPTTRATPTVRATTPTVPAAATSRASTYTGPAAKPAPQKSSKLPLIITAITLLLVIGGAAGVYFVKGDLPLIGKFLPKRGPATVATTDDSAPPAVDPAAEKEAPAGPFFPGDNLVINGMSGKMITLLGVLEQVRPSKTGKTIYLEFEKTAPFSYACGYIMKADAPGDLAIDQLKPLVGKRVRITGIVEIDKKSKPPRPQILIRERKSIEAD